MAAIFNRVVKKGLCKRVTTEQSSKGREGANIVAVQGQSLSAQGTAQMLAGGWSLPELTDRESSWWKSLSERMFYV